MTHPVFDKELFIDYVDTLAHRLGRNSLPCGQAKFTRHVKAQSSALIRPGGQPP
jgi:hypothetical protein